ncbi:MAG: hypothetical protein IT285_07450, partial [Bdellovibrionales bacterium]|nr:hypothetical protein [Bdellovibrionales bacterium]
MQLRRASGTLTSAAIGFFLFLCLAPDARAAEVALSPDGKAWMTEESGIRVLRLSGTEVEMAAQHGALAR